MPIKQEIKKEKIYNPDQEIMICRGNRPIAPIWPIAPAFKIRPKSLSSLMAGFKSSVTLKINQLRDTPGQLFWQCNYYNRIIRNDKELNLIRKCIIDNPGKWNTDEEIHLNEYGKMVQTEWLKSSEIRNEIGLDAFQIMPNHFHGIVIIQNGAMDDRGNRPIAPT